MKQSHSLSTRMSFEAYPVKHRITWVFALPLIVLACIILGQMMVVIPAVKTGFIARDAFEVYPNILYFLVAPFTANICLIFLWVRFFERRTLSSLGLKLTPALPKNIALGYLTALVMGSLVVAFIFISGGYEQAIPSLGRSSSLIPVLLLFFAFGVQSSVEEIVFRGYLFSRFSERYGLWIGIAANSVLFTLLHLLNFDFETRSLLSLFLFSFMTLVFSIYLSLKVIQLGTIWFACAWHAGWNWLFICGFGVPTTGITLDIRPLIADFDLVSQSPDWLTGGIGGPEDSIFTSAILIIMCIVGIYRCRKINALITKVD
jgi:membrane protease YdiL (CAAX protease family)